MKEYSIAVFDNKIILGFYDMQVGYYPNEDGWAIYNMDTETWSGKPSGLPEEFSGSPSNFQIIDNELYVVLIELMYDLYPTIYKSADGINWTKASLIAADEDVSSWAIDEINEALALRLIPSPLQSSYHSTITREEFADLIVNYIDEQNWQGLDVFLENRGVEISEDPFTDTNKESVRIAYSLGIINGKGDHIFDPNGSITREEAAVMLYRVIQLFEDEQTVEPLTFADEDSFASWSGDSVKMISALGIMNGTGDNQFSPSGTYTREQAYMTIVRLFKYLY